MAKPKVFIPVASTMLNGVSYDSETSQLYVQFKNGSTWEYDDVPAEVADGLTAGGSAGSFFHNQIKDQYDGRSV